MKLVKAHCRLYWTVEAVKLVHVSLSLQFRPRGRHVSGVTVHFVFLCFCHIVWQPNRLHFQQLAKQMLFL